MKDHFLDELRRKTDGELMTIARDTAFYSEQERFIALNELEKRGPLPAGLTELKTTFGPSCRSVLIPESERPTQKIYKQGHLWGATFWGGPLVAGYLIAANFKAFGEPEKVKMTWVWTVLATVAVFGAALSIPEESKIPNVAIPLAYTAVTVLITERLQGRRITAHLAAGGSCYSWGRAIVVGLIGCAATLVGVLVVVAGLAAAGVLI